MTNPPLNWKRIFPIITAILVFIGITIAYFSPLLEGKRLDQHDINMFKGMSKEIADFREKTGEEALWTNSMFGGMPAWQISVVYNGNLIRYLKQVIELGLPYPANAVFVYFLGFFILLLVMGVDPWVSLAGAIAFGLSSYFFIIIGAGHTSKAHAIGYMAPVIAGIVLAYKGNYLKGALLTSIALALEIEAGHLQITYYLLLIVLILGLAQLIDAIRFKTLPHFGKATGYLVIAALLAIMTHFTSLYAAYDYGKDTTRGKPILTKDVTDQTGGLDRSYITHWSYGIGETWSLMIPNAKGGASAMIGSKHPSLENAERGIRQAVAQQNAYWGDQPGTSGPVYAGAIIIFLFVLGAFFVKGKYKWVLLGATFMSIILAWGKNYMPATNFFLDYIPGYDKFRAVTMTLVIAELCIPLLAFLGLYEIYKNPSLLKEKQKYFFIAFGFTGGLSLLFYLLPGMFFNFQSAEEITEFAKIRQTNPSDAGQIDMFIKNLEAVRIGIFKADAIRSFMFISIAAALIYAYGINKLKQNYLLIALTLLILVDMVMIDNRYLNNNKFVSKQKTEVPFQASTANKAILKDNEPGFRVLDLTTSTFNDASTSYFHRSIGGYHGAKLQRYQDLIENNLQYEISDFGKVMQNKPDMMSLDTQLDKSVALNMLNTRYIIYNPQAAPIPNQHAFGSAWLVNSIVWAANANQEIELLKSTDLQSTAVVHEEFRKEAGSIENKALSNVSIELVKYEPNKLEYQVKSNQTSLAVFSEIWTSKGWNAYIDNTKTPLLRANYLLRAVVIPEGEHKVVLKYEPKIWSVGQTISFASSFLLLAAAIALAVIEWRRRKQTSEA
ncbi:MAG: YfhO family protein [Bacteroidales bacterium]